MEMRGRQLRVASQQPLQYGSLGCTGYKEGNLSAAFERRIRQCYARLGLGAEHGADPAPALSQDRRAGEERGDVPIGAEPKECNVEQRAVGSQARCAVEVLELSLVGERRLIRCEALNRHGMIFAGGIGASASIACRTMR